MLARKGLSNIFSAAIVFALVSILLSAIIYYLDMKSREIEYIGENFRDEIIRESESLKVRYSNGLVIIGNEGDRNVLIEGIFLGSGGRLDFINISKEVSPGESLEIEIGNSYSRNEIYVITSRGRVFTPLNDEPDTNSNGEIVIKSFNNSVSISRLINPGTSYLVGKYLPINILYLNDTGKVYYEIDIINTTIIYGGGYPLYVSKDGRIILSKHAVYQDFNRLYYYDGPYNLQPLYIGYNYLAFISPGRGVYLVYNGSLTHLGNISHNKVSSDYLYSISLVGMYNGRYLYKVKVYDEYFNHRVLYINLDLGLDGFRLVLNDSGYPKRVLGWIKVYKGVNGFSHIYNVSIPLDLIGYYKDGNPIYARVKGVLLTIFNDSDEDMNYFNISGPLYEESGVRKMIWGIVNKSINGFYEDSSKTTLSYVDVFGDRNLVSQMIRFRSGYKCYGSLYDRVTIRLAVKYIFKPLGSYLIISSKFTYEQHPISIRGRYNQSIRIVYFDGIRSAELYTFNETTGYVYTFYMNFISGGFVIPLEIGIEKAYSMISFSVFKTLNYTGLYSSEEGFIIYKPKFLTHIKIPINDSIDSIQIEVYNYTYIKPINPNSIYDDYIAISVFSVSNDILSMISRDLYTADIPTDYSMGFLPNYIIVNSHYHHTPVFLGWSYAFPYSYIDEDLIDTEIYYVTNRSFSDLYHLIKSIGVWIYRMDVESPYLVKADLTNVPYDSILIPTSKYIIIFDPSGRDVLVIISKLTI